MEAECGGVMALGTVHTAEFALSFVAMVTFA